MSTLQSLISTLADETDATELRVELHDSCGTDYLGQHELVLCLDDEARTDELTQHDRPQTLVWRGDEWTVHIVTGWSRQTDTVRVYTKSTGVTLSALATAVDWHHYQTYPTQEIA